MSLETEEKTMREVIGETIGEEMARDDSVFIQGIDVAGRGGTFDLLKGLVEDFGEERVRSTPVSEAAIVGSGLGAAATGMRPIVEIMYSGFMGVAMDQLLNNVSKMRYMFGGELALPLTIRTQDTSGFRAGAQHTQSLHHMITGLPGIKTVCCSTPRDTKGLLKSAIRSDDPVFLFEHAACYNRSGQVPIDEDFTIPIGEAAVEREGTDVTIVATHIQLWNALEAANIVADRGIDVEVVNPRTFDPLDVDTIVYSAQKTGRVVVVDESPVRMGTQSDIAAEIMEHAFFDLDFPVLRVGVPNVPIPFSPPLEDEVIPQTSDIVEAVEKLA